METPDFAQRLEAVPVPDTLNGLSEDEASEGIAAEVRRRFFDEVAGSIMSYLAIQACTEERITELKPLYAPKYIHELWINEAQPIAYAYSEPESLADGDEQGNAPRLRSVSFGKYPLMNATQRALIEIDTLEDIISRP